MPLYDYSCTACGPFRQWRGMDESGNPAACPQCGECSPRLVQAPFMPLLTTNGRIAHQRNEKSAHEPQVMSRKQFQSVGGQHHHGHHHGDTAGGGWQRSSRPWMIGH